MEDIGIKKKNFLTKKRIEKRRAWDIGIICIVYDSEQPIIK